MAIDATKVDNINNILNPESTSKSGKAKTAFSNDLNDFLRLLTTQLKNQDPTNPFDTNQFTQQMAQLATVEQSINTNTNLENLISMYATSQMNGVVSYIGKRIEAVGDKSSLSGGQAMFVYDLEGEAKEVEVTISNAAGNVVFSGQGDNQVGHNEVFWDGKNSYTGKQMPDGVYTIAVKAKDEVGKEVKSTVYSTGRVTAVDIQNGKPTLLMDSYEIPLDRVLKISEDPLLALGSA